MTPEQAYDSFRSALTNYRNVALKNLHNSINEYVLSYLDRYLFIRDYVVFMRRHNEFDPSIDKEFSLTLAEYKKLMKVGLLNL